MPTLPVEVILIISFALAVNVISSVVVYVILPLSLSLISPRLSVEPYPAAETT